MKLGVLVQGDCVVGVVRAEDVPAVPAVVFADEDVEGGVAGGSIAGRGGVVRLPMFLRWWASHFPELLFWEEVIFHDCVKLLRVIYCLALVVRVQAVERAMETLWWGQRGVFGISLGRSKDCGHVEWCSGLLDLLVLIGLSVLKILVQSR